MLGFLVTEVRRVSTGEEKKRGSLSCHIASTHHMFFQLIASLSSAVNAPFPPMMWHSWGLFTSEDLSNEANMQMMADALIKSGMAEAGASFATPARCAASFAFLCASHSAASSPARLRYDQRRLQWLGGAQRNDGRADREPHAVAVGNGRV